MKPVILLCSLAALLAGNGGYAQELSLTLYNQNFAVVRDTVALDLKAGDNDVAFSGATYLLEPESVILRDAAGNVPLQILEQSYRNDPVSQSLLLSFNEGKEIEFESTLADGRLQRVTGKVIRSGHRTNDQPIIEVAGKLQFGLPGRPIFPALHGDAILKPTLNWKLHSEAAAQIKAEVAYITGGMTWQADYNFVAPEKGNTLDVLGWITMDNQTGRAFEQAGVKLIAGDVSRVQPAVGNAAGFDGLIVMAAPATAPMVSEKSFDEYHLYSLARPVTLRDREKKQVEFLRAPGVKSKRVYIYDGWQPEQWHGMTMENLRDNEGLNVEFSQKVAVVAEIENKKENGLGVALPKGKVRFYRQDSDGRLEFTGENEIDHTPRNETLRIYTGNAFDLIGERVRTDVKVDSGRSTATESFKITLRNRKKEPVQIVVVEHLYRWTSWEITQSTLPPQKKAAQVIEFLVSLGPDQVKEIQYTVLYRW